MDKKYQPYHIILFIILSFLILGAVVIFVPDGKIMLGSYEFRFLSQKKLLKENKKQAIDLQSIIASVDTTMIDDEEEPVNKEVKPIQAPIKDSDLLVYNEQGKANLTAFFHQLNQASSKKIRILHYGDSQIEGDRITGFLRQRIQTKFGGNGPGFIPAVNVYNTLTFNQIVSDNFERYTNFGGNPLKTNHYGILNTVGRFTPESVHREEKPKPKQTVDSLSVDSIIVDSDSINEINTIENEELNLVEAWVEIEAGDMTYAKAKNYKHVYIHYTQALKPCGIKVFQNDDLIVSDSLKADGQYHIYPLHFSENPGKLRFEYTAESSPNILAYSLEGDKGVQVDNIAMRGSSGMFFGKINQSLAKRIYDEQNVQLFIMQYGGNSVPYINDSTDAKNNATYFKGQLQAIKRLRPEAAIIVIGPSDMSTLIDGEYTTYPLLPYFIDQLKTATKEVGGAYFDMFLAMGGMDSMLAWVDNGLAGKDYIHFTTQGTRIVAQKFYDMLMAAYNELMQ